MKVLRVQLQNFRNYTEQTVEFGPGINLITGKNAQGKTNLLESVLMLCVGKSVRAKDRDLIMSGRDRARIAMLAEKIGGSVRTEMILSRGENKRILFNGIPLLRTGELLGNVAAIYFQPDDLSLIKDAPESRRRFLDMDLSQAYKSYFYALTRYNKALLSRNNLLKQGYGRDVGEMLFPYDVQLSREGGIIISRRREYLARLVAEAKRVHAYLTDGEEDLDFSYASQISPEGDPAALLAEALKGALEKDMKLKFTTVGPHRDDIRITANGVDLRVKGSQGQQRTAALSLKLAELGLFREIGGEVPILLLDDVLSELDDDRARRLLELCADSQSLITAASVDPALFEGLPVTRFLVKGGQVSQETD